VRSAPPVPPLLVLAFSLLLALACAGQAMAAGKVTRAGAVLTVDTGTGAVDGLHISTTSTEIHLLRLSQTVLALAGSGCDEPTAGTVECAATGSNRVDRVIVRTRDANDAVLLPGALTLPTIVEVDLGAGGDSYDSPGHAGTVVASGGDGDDFLTTGAGNDILRGGSGSDTLSAGRGLDDVGGGSGHDLVLYDERTVPLRVSFDGVGDDGEAAIVERDNVRPDVEHVIGGSAADVLVGDAGSDELHGADGNDRLDGRGGVDRFAGGNGADTILARDGLAERIACGEGADRAVVDDIDTTSGCEIVQSAADLQPDRDGDGIDAPADCRDTVAAIRPGAFDVPGNGVDEDCRGGDAVDLDPDRDGFPLDQDCDDTTARIRPGGVEVFGNETDEDCNGTPEPFPVFEARVRLSSLVFAKPSYTEVTGLLLSALGDGDRIVVRCKGKGCPIKSRRPKPPKGGGDLAYGKRFKGARLKPGARVVVRITRADGVGAVSRFKMRAAQPPKRRLRCFDPVRGRTAC